MKTAHGKKPARPFTAKHLAKRIGDAEKAFTTTLVAKELGKPRETKLLQRASTIFRPATH